jgi:DNA-binding PadR family transcriptional regulator
MNIHAGNRDPLSFLPLTTVELEILLSVAGDGRHGSAIMQDVEARSAGSLVLRPGTLYRAISRLLADGLIAERDAPADADSTDERRRYYRLTPLGYEVSALEARRLARQVRTVRVRRLLQGEV